MLRETHHFMTIPNHLLEDGVVVGGRQGNVGWIRRRQRESISYNVVLLPAHLFWRKIGGATVVARIPGLCNRCFGFCRSTLGLNQAFSEQWWR